MRDVDSHLAAALSLVNPLPIEMVALDDALGRTLAVDLVSRWASPPFTNSAMDGYALRGADAAGARADSPVLLALVGESAAGRPFSGVVNAGEAVRVMTGAEMPAGADAVVPVELADDDGSRVTVRAAPGPAAHVRLVGEDLPSGSVFLEAGTRLTPARLAAAASVGHAAVPVRRRSVVALLSTGDELVAPGIAPGPGQIADSNAVALDGLVRAAGAEPLRVPRIPDDAEALLDALAGVSADIIVTTGGVSAGAYDIVRQALDGRGVEFVPVAMQPGKPQGLGRLGGTPIVCLPGNPVSVVASFVVFVRPMLRVLAGEPALPSRTAVVGEGWHSPAGRRQFVPVRFLPDGTVAPATSGGSGSHLVGRLAAADALAVVGAAIDTVSVGDIVEVLEVA